MIPRIVHQTWINNDIPIICNSYVKSVKKHFKNWEYKLWTDEECIKLLQNYYPKIYKVALSCSNNGEKADLFRYCILHKYGGLYFDIDYECLNSFEHIENFKKYELFLFKETNSFYKEFGSRDIIANCVLGAKPNTYFFERLIQSIKNNIFYKIAYKASNKKLCKIDSTLFKTGPFLVTKVFETYKKKLPISKCFLGNSEEFTSNKNTSKAFGIHHSMHSWIK